MPHPLQRAVALIVLVLFAPLMICVATLIRVVDGGPVLFSQTRIGYKREAFTLWKFRTMKNGADRELVYGVDPTSRLTRTGAALRRTALDELPQLLNVVRGDMTGVGPRALLPEVARNVPAQYDSRFDVLPGLTGLAQVSGRNSLPWSKRLELDARYARHRSVRLDVSIALRTFSTLATGAGFSADRNTEVVDDLGLLRPDDEQI
ncbi:sugar transferase [Georgenia faecalis]|uniref:sugar transferase n=1 Tax=Georgenia faecalis TaxID=2483799 RepID=UPI000FDC0EA6|nr:sugar transferase [Georgenia faecalis]